MDKFGDNILCCKEIPGDSWRHRHDEVKMALYREACLAKVPADCEVYGLFGDLLPAALLEEGGELQWGRARQGKVPDFKFLLSTPEGPKPCLAELKVISAGKTWFPRGVAFAESRVAATSRAQGWEAGDGQLGMVMGEVRRAMSVTVVRANAHCLLERLSQLGAGAGAAARRRQDTLRLEERRRQDRQAFDLAWQARGSNRVGRAFI